MRALSREIGVIRVAERREKRTRDGRSEMLRPEG